MSDREGGTLGLEAIVARCEAATPGPWGGGAALTPAGTNYVVRVIDRNEEGLRRTRFICQMLEMANGSTDLAANADFIAHAREDVPALVHRIEELEAEVIRLRAESEGAVVGIDDAAHKIVEWFHATAKEPMPFGHEVAHVRSFLRNAIKEGKTQGWRTIESAPKGEHLLFFPEQVGRNHLGVMAKVDHYPVGYPRKPTHWMPLPVAPTDTSKESGL